MGELYGNLMRLFAVVGVAEFILGVILAVGAIVGLAAIIVRRRRP